MRRRKFFGLTGGPAWWPLAARAQQPAKSFRVAYLALLGDQDATIRKPRLNELGYAEGRNLTFDVHSAPGQPEFLP
jgi:putative tryptophan/tyrosine transport system substrate-binding protein